MIKFFSPKEKEFAISSCSLFQEATSLGMVPRVSFKDSPIVVDARKLQIHIVEVRLFSSHKELLCHHPRLLALVVSSAC